MAAIETLRFSPADSEIVREVANGSGSTQDAGSSVVFAGGVGVRMTTVADGANGPIFIGGVHRLPKVSAQAWTQGAKIYWDDTAKNYTTTSTSNTFAGFAYEAAANPSSYGYVHLNPPPGT